MLERRERLEVETAFVGRQLGTGAFRESLAFRMPSAGLRKADSPVSGGGVLSEAVELVGETDDAGTEPLVLEAITDRLWLPPL